MDLEKIVAQLHGELDRIENAMTDLESARRKCKHGRSRPAGLVARSNRNKGMKASAKQSGGFDG
jgi:hypothetical protein